MSESENKRVVRNLVNAVNRHDVEAVLDMCTDDVVVIYPSLRRLDREQYGKDLAHEWETIPDISLQVMDIISKGNTVVFEWYWRGTRTGEYHGRPATNETYEAPGVFIIELEKSKIKLIKYYWNPALMLERN